MSRRFLVVTFNGSRPAMDTIKRPQLTPPLSAVGLPANGHGRSAFWTMTRRVTVIAAGVDLAFLLLFSLLSSPVLAWLNVLSVGCMAPRTGCCGDGRTTRRWC